MKKILWFAFIVFGCSTSTPPVKILEIHSRDSIATRLYPQLILKITKLKFELQKLGDSNNSLLAQIDSLQNDVLKYQGNTLQLKSIELKLAKLVDENKILINRAEYLSRQNSELNETNIFIADSLRNTRVSLYKTTAERDSYKKALHFQIAHVSVSAWGFVITSLFKKAVLKEVELARQTTYLEVNFDVVANDKIDKTTYVLNVRIRGVNGRGINKDVLVHFNGLEQDGLSVKFDDPQEFQVGFHHVEISLGDVQLYSGTIYLK